MTNKETGLWIKGKFYTDQQIKQNLIIRGELPQLTRKEPLTIPSFERRAEIIRQRSEQAKELSTNTNKTEVTLPRTSIVSFIGDMHIGHPKVDYQRIQQEVEAIANTPDSYAVLMGDEVDGICWGGEGQSEQVGSLDEQHGFMQSMVRKLKGKIIAGFSGEHSSKWTARSGPDAMARFQEDSQAPYIKGIGQINLKVGEQEYKVVAGHKLRGHSIYNNTHPEMRAMKEFQGADIYAGAHYHTKGIAQQPLRTTEGAKVVTHISIGTYKAGDSWSGREGYPDQEPEQMGGVSVRLRSDRKEIEICDNIVEAHRRWGGWLGEIFKNPEPIKLRKEPNNGLLNQNLKKK